MARGGLRTLGVGLVGFAVALAIGEVRFGPEAPALTLRPR